MPQTKSGKLPFCSWYGNPVTLTKQNRQAKEENIRRAEERAQKFREEEEAQRRRTAP